MKARTLLLLLTIASFSWLILSPTLNSNAVALAQTQQPAPKLSDKEIAALKAVETAPDPAAKLTAAEEFIKKFPKSSARKQLLNGLVGEILNLKDFKQAVALSERAQQIFTNAEEQDLVGTILLDSYTNNGQADDAFRVGTEMLKRDGQDLHALMQLTYIGTEEVRKNQNGKYAQQSLQYGLKSIEMIEGNQKPAKMDEANWTGHKERLPQSYQQTAILNSALGNAAEAKNRALKATVLSPNDPIGFAILGGLINMEYTALATKHRTMPAGEEKQQTQKKAEGLIDELIDAYAHVVALAGGRPEYQALSQQVTEDLTTYYKYRHNQSVEGLQQLIDKYKVQPKP